MKRSLLLALLAPVLTATTLKAPIFLEIEGIKGESSGTNHAQTIEIESFSWGANNASSSGGAGSGKVKFNEARFTTRISKATPLLLLACTSTNPIPHATLFVSKSEEEPLDYYKITFDNVLVSSLNQISAGATTTTSSTNSPPPSGGSDRPMETLSLNFDKITLSYTASDGTVTTGTAERDPVR